MSKPTTDNIIQAMQLEIEKLEDKLEEAEATIKAISELIHDALSLARKGEHPITGYIERIYELLKEQDDDNAPHN